MNIGMAIRNYLKEQGQKQAWLADQLGIKPSTLSASLSNELSASRFFEICDILNVSPDYFYDKCRGKKIIEIKD